MEDISLLNCSDEMGEGKKLSLVFTCNVKVVEEEDKKNLLARRSGTSRYARVSHAGEFCS